MWFNVLGIRTPVQILRATSAEVKQLSLYNRQKETNMDIVVYIWAFIFLVAVFIEAANEFFKWLDNLLKRR